MPTKNVIHNTIHIHHTKPEKKKKSKRRHARRSVVPYGGNAQGGLASLAQYIPQLQTPVHVNKPQYYPMHSLMQQDAPYNAPNTQPMIRHDGSTSGPIIFEPHTPTQPLPPRYEHLRDTIPPPTSESRLDDIYKYKSNPMHSLRKRVEHFREERQRRREENPLHIGAFDSEVPKHTSESDVSDLTHRRVHPTPMPEAKADAKEVFGSALPRIKLGEATYGYTVKGIEKKKPGRKPKQATT